MNELIQKIKDLPHQEVDYKFLKSFVDSIDVDQLDFQDFLPKPNTPFEYGRNILTLQPFECVLLNWPPGVESAIHLHKGLFGFVLVLQGGINNHFYLEKPGELTEYEIQTYLPKGMLYEPDGAIHKIANNSKTQNAVTLHFYYPAIENLEGIQIYQETTGNIGILSKHAKSACWSDDPKHFDSIQYNAFKFLSLQDQFQNKSHLIHPVYPKPSSDNIKKMNKAYYNEQAFIYDELDQKNSIRKAYTEGIDNLIASDFKNNPNTIHKVLDIATGTGRRPIHIKILSGFNYSIFGVESSEEMALKAGQKGIPVILADWISFNLQKEAPFDAITLLYGFGHIPNIESRIKLLQNINQHLKLGASFYFDTFNINNQNEWGPTCKKHFEQYRQQENGYQEGDIFYKRLEGEEIAFLHYFNKEELLNLLVQTGFEMEYCKIIGYIDNPGEELNNDNQGLYFIKAKKINEC